MIANRLAELDLALPDCGLCRAAWGVRAAGRVPVEAVARLESTTGIDNAFRFGAALLSPRKAALSRSLIRAHYLIAAAITDRLLAKTSLLMSAQIGKVPPAVRWRGFDGNTMPGSSFLQMI